MNDWDQLDMLDLLVEPDHERRQALLDARWNVDPLHRVIPQHHWLCGRCGEIARFTTDHDAGYTGCPIDSDPTWRRYPRRTDGRGHRGHGVTGYEGRGILTVADLCDRWDARWWPDCQCGHPWGVHVQQYGFAEPEGSMPLSCSTYCGCADYEQVTA